MSLVRKNIDFLSDGAVGRETFAATPSEFRDIAEWGRKRGNPLCIGLHVRFVGTRKPRIVCAVSLIESSLMVEVRGVEPLSEMASPKRLRV